MDAIIIMLAVLLAFSVGACLTERNFGKVHEDCKCDCDLKW